MNAKWLLLASELLKLASDEFGSHGCNDLKWPEGWSKEERHALAEAVVRDNIHNLTGPLSEDDRVEVEHMAESNYGPGDSWLMSFFAGQLKAMADK